MAAVPVALEGTAFAAPISLGATALLYAKIGGAFVIPAIVAALLGMVLVHLATAGGGRPMVYATRVMDASMMLGFLDLFIQKMPGWGLADTPEHRLLLVLAVSIGGALLLPLFYLLRLQRFARMIPTPVLYGFNTALAVTVTLSQVSVLRSSWPLDGPWFVAVALLVLLVAIALQRRAPRWPAGVAGIVAGAAVVYLAGVAGVHSFSSTSLGALAPVLPIQLVPWRDALAPDVATWSILKDVALASTTLAGLIFVNTVVSEAALSQLDGAQAHARDWWTATLAGFAATLAGSTMLAPTMAPTRAALRVGRIGWRAMVLTAVYVLLALGSGVLSWIPPATVCGLLLFDAWMTYHRPSAELLWRALRRKVELGASEKEDLAMIGGVVLVSVLFNMVVGVLAGVLTGLVLYAWRNGRRLARVVQDGTLARSNCVRSRADAARLAEQAQQLRYVELEGALFFGAAAALQSLLRAQCAPGHVLVVDWSHVISTDSTVAAAFGRVLAEARDQQMRVAISGPNAAVRQVMRAEGLRVRLYPDADRALEWAEGVLIERRGPALTAEVTQLHEAITLLRGLDAEQRAVVEPLFEQRFVEAHQPVFAEGGANDELMVILQGSVDVMAAQGDGREVRLARLRRGAVLGELAFLDGSSRSAGAIAAEDVLLGVLSRERFEQLLRDRPDIGQRLALNLAGDLAQRLRRTSRLAVRSLTGHGGAGSEDARAA